MRTNIVIDDKLTADAPLCVDDLILTEILQGCVTDKEFNLVRRGHA